VAGKTVARKSGESKAFWMLNSLYDVKVAGDETGGALTLMEMTIPKGWGPPPHTHPGAETVYVVEGSVLYHIGDETIEGGPGSAFHVPGGTLEWFEPASEVVRVLIAYTPGGIDQFFAEVGEPAQKRELPPLSQEPPDFERMAAIGAKHGMNIQPPPGA
jgi:quercetin dioxygenase-like cupin family protein